MKTTDFKFKSPVLCVVKDCLEVASWISEQDEDIGLCDKHYLELELSEYYNPKIFNKN